MKCCVGVLERVAWSRITSHPFQNSLRRTWSFHGADQPVDLVEFDTYYRRSAAVSERVHLGSILTCFGLRAGGPLPGPILQGSLAEALPTFQGESLPQHPVQAVCYDLSVGCQNWPLVRLAVFFHRLFTR